MTHSDIRRDSFTCWTWLIHMWDVTHSRMCVTWLIHTCVWRDSFTRVCDVTHSRVCVTWLTHTCVWRNGLFLLQITFMRQIGLQCISLFSRKNEAFQKDCSFDIDPGAFLRRMVFQGLLCVFFFSRTTVCFFFSRSTVCFFFSRTTVYFFWNTTWCFKDYCAWHDTLQCVSHMWNTTWCFKDYCVWHDTFVCVTWRMCVPRHIHGVWMQRTSPQNPPHTTLPDLDDSGRKRALVM